MPFLFITQPITVSATTTPPTPLVEPIEQPSDTIYNNCWLYVKSRFKNLPNTSEIQPNIEPTVNAIAIFNYDGKPHYAIEAEIWQDATSTRIRLEESNFGEDKISKDRWINPETDPNFLGSHLPTS